MTDDGESELSSPPESAPDTERPSPGGSPRGPAKGPAAFRTISEASAQVGVPQHVLRFWETRFAFIRPTKRAGGRRFYRPQDLDVLRGVRVLLQEEGYTIRGVQKLHREQGLKRLLAASGSDATPTVDDGDVAAPAPARTSATVHLPTDVVALEEPETRDLFDDAVEAAAPEPPAAPTPAPAPSVPPIPPESRSASTSRPILDDAARARLRGALEDLEAAKAEIDGLLLGD